jgi:hypothetical protein
VHELNGEGLPFALQTGPSLRGTSFPLSIVPQSKKYSDIWNGNPKIAVIFGVKK